MGVAVLVERLEHNARTLWGLLTEIRDELAEINRALNNILTELEEQPDE